MRILRLWTLYCVGRCALACVAGSLVRGMLFFSLARREMRAEGFSARDQD